MLADPIESRIGGAHAGRQTRNSTRQRGQSRSQSIAVSGQTMLPKIATPSADPSSRVVSFVAEPTPAEPCRPLP